MKLRKIEIRDFKGLKSIVVDECGDINALVGKNNSGKSSILHAIDMAGLALSVNAWNSFQPKLEIKDLFAESGDFAVALAYDDGSEVVVKATREFGPTFNTTPRDDQKYKSILVWPDVSAGMKQRRHRTPHWIITQVENRNYAQVDSLEILYAVKYYANRRERGLVPDDYKDLIDEIQNYFPDIENVSSSRTEQDIATLTYTEYGHDLDILYSGSGLKHFIDILLKTTISGANVVLLDEPEMGLHPDLQRRFLGYLDKLVQEKDLQIFMATHSQVLLNYADTLEYYRVVNSSGTRTVIPVPDDAIHTLLSDMGLRPSDVFNQDVCVLVEGASEVVFIEHVLREIYSTEFEKLAIGVVQYGGSSADGIISGAISVQNIVPAQEYTFWIRDRDSKPGDAPSTEATKFRNALDREGLKCHIWNKREIEYYYPESVLVAAQEGDKAKEDAVLEILRGDQSEKFRKAAKSKGICVPSGTYLRRLLLDHVREKTDLDAEIRNIVEDTLIPWKREILGEEVVAVVEEEA